MNSRQKGARGEREWRDFLKREGGYHARRGQQFSGANGDPDVVCEELDGFVHMEVKRVENLNLYRAMEQSIADAEVKGETPVVAHRKNGKPWLVTMRAEDWLRVTDEWRKARLKAEKEI